MMEEVFVDHNSFLYLHPLRESSSVGRARPCQGRGRGFESRFSLQMPPTREASLFSAVPQVVGTAWLAVRPGW
jgi:hypothetical protein